MIKTFEYNFIKEYYKNKKAKRTGVDYMNHIDEGIKILESIDASSLAKRAYCLHPIFQSDGDLLKNYDILMNYYPNYKVILCAIEYRNIANDYLSRKEINSLTDIKLSPLKDVNDMLIADKVQNKKDFMKYHYGTHPRSEELLNYFNNWLKRLGISDEKYENLIKII